MSGRESENRAVEPDEVLIARDGPVLTLTFNRPAARNALTWAMYERLTLACEEVDGDDSIRVLILRGAGGQAFVAGTDIGQFQAFSGSADGIAYERGGDRHIGRLAAVRKPVIAAIEGFAVGAGLRIAGACDLRIATPDARFGAPIARTLGNCLSADAYAGLVDLLGPSRVTALLFTAQLLGAQEAHAAGFVHEIVAPDAMDGRVRALAREIAGHAPITLRVTKEALRRIRAARPVPDIDDLISETYGSADFREGVRAFLEKRTPQWRGHLVMTTPQAASVPHETYATRFSFRPVALGRRGMVAAANPLASLAGLKMLARGGNAVDALVAAAAAIGVAEPYMSGLAGCGVLVLTRPGHRPQVLNFLGRAPSGTSRERMHGANHTSGPLSVAVPGNLAGWARVLADHGTLSLAEVLEPAAELAETGPPLTPFDRQMFDEHLTHLDAEAVRNYLHGGRTPALGAAVTQPNLAATFRRIGREGIQAVYGGALGEGIVKALGGIMTRADLEAYPGRLRWDDPLTTTYRDVEVFAPAPPSSGLQVLQTLNGMGGWNLGGMEHLGPDHLSIIAEASRAARVDTHRHIGDPDVVPVPVDRLLGVARTEAIRAEMRARLEAPRRPVAVAGGSGGDGGASTTHLAAMDSSGLAVNVTQSLGNGFGSGIVVPGTGICLNNALHWTSTEPGHPNVVEPGKRHEWPVAPVQLFRGGKLWGTVGTPGSYGILVTTVQVLANLIDFGLNVQDAIGAPRFRWLDEAIDPLPADRLRIESRVPEGTRRALAARGYGLEVMGAFSMRVGGVQAIFRDHVTGWLMGGADPRRNGYAMGW